MRHKMKSIEYVQRIDRLHSDDFQTRPPHVAADNFQLCTALFAKSSGKSQKSFDGSLFTHPKQALGFRINLVNQGQIISAILPLSFVDPNWLYTRQILMFPPSIDGHLNRIEDVVPCASKCSSHLLPTHYFLPNVPNTIHRNPQIGASQ